MDYSIIMIFSLVILAFCWNIYYNYISRMNKISDKQLMQNYIIWTMKKNNIRYYPKFNLENMEIK